MGMKNWFNSFTGSGTIVNDPAQTATIQPGMITGPGSMGYSHQIDLNDLKGCSSVVDTFTNPFTGASHPHSALTSRFTTALLAAVPDVNAGNFIVDEDLIAFVHGDPIMLEKACITLEKLRHTALAGLEFTSDHIDDINILQSLKTLTLSEYVTYYNMAFRYLKSMDNNQHYNDNPFILKPNAAVKVKEVFKKIEPCLHYFRAGDATNAIIGINLLGSLVGEI